MAICPSGHSSAAADYCDVCGARIGMTPPAPAAGPAGGAFGGAVGGTAAGGCPDCGTPRTGRFCENCGYDHELGGGRPTPARPSAPPGVTGPSAAAPGPVPSGMPGAAPAGEAPEGAGNGPTGPAYVRVPSGGTPGYATGGAPGAVPAQESGTVRWTPRTPPATPPGPTPDQESGTVKWTPPGSAPGSMPGYLPGSASGAAPPGAGSAEIAVTGMPGAVPPVPGAGEQAEAADEEEPVTRDWTPSPGHFPRPAVEWAAVVGADRDYYERVIVEGGDYAFPPYAPERQIPLTGTRMRIGRRSVSTGTVPEIDLAEPPADPGVSHTHAVLLAKPDGTWTLVDPGSTNGTTMNGGDEPLPVNVEVPLRDGDRIHLGVWTTITLRRLR